MFLGRLAVGLLIFVIVIAMIVSIYKSLTDTSAVDLTGWAVMLTIAIATYCTGSGLYLLIHFGYL